MKKRIVITGATGFIGRRLSLELAEAGYEVIALSRRAATEWSDQADGATAIVNLAGENIGAGRWTARRKQQILESRLNAGKAVTDAIRMAERKPSVLIQASGVGYYGDRGDEMLDEEASNGSGFLADVARQWEQSVLEVGTLGVRLAAIRLGVVLGPNGTGCSPRSVSSSEVTPAPEDNGSPGSISMTSSG